MKDSNRKDKRMRNERTGISPWNIEEDDYSDFIKHCCVKSMTRLAKWPQKCRRKSQKEADGEDESQMTEGKINFMNKLCPKIDDKEKFLLDFNRAMESEVVEETNNKQTKQRENSEATGESFERRKTFEEKPGWKRSRSSDIVPTSSFNTKTNNTTTKQPRSRSTPSWNGGRDEMTYHDMRQMIDEKVRCADGETSHHIWELANLFCTPSRPRKIQDEKAMLLLNQDLVSPNINPSQLHPAQLFKKNDSAQIKNPEIEEEKRSRIKTNDHNVYSDKKEITKVMVILPSVNCRPTGDENVKNFPCLPTFKMVVNATKPNQQQQQQQQINENSTKTVNREKANIQPINFPKLNVTSHNFPGNPKFSDICRKSNRNLKANVDPHPTQQIVFEDNMKYDHMFLQSSRRWNGAVGSLYSRPKKNVPRHQETTKKIDKNSSSNKHSDLKAENLLFLK